MLGLFVVSMYLPYYVTPMCSLISNYLKIQFTYGIIKEVFQNLIHQAVLYANTTSLRPIGRADVKIVFQPTWGSSARRRSG